MRSQEAPPPVPPTRPARRAAPWEAELLGRWRFLEKRFAKVLSPQALAVTVALGISLMLSWLLQFATGAFEAMPALSVLFAVINTLLALLAMALVVLRGRFLREQIMVLVVMAGVVALSMGALVAKLHYQRGLAGNPYYALPHTPTPLPATAVPVTLKTSDGVRLEGYQLGTHHSRAVVIYPTWRTNRTAFSVMTLALWLSNGFDVLVIDPRGQGDSGGAKTPDGAAKHDVLAGVSYLKSTGHERIGVLAELDGADAAAGAAAMHQGIDSLALVLPSRNWGEDLGQEGRLWDPDGLLGRLYWRSVAGLRLAGGAPAAPLTAILPGVAPTPLLLIGHKGGVGTPLDLLHGAAREPKSLMVIPGEERPVGWAHFAEYYKIVEQWFEMSLRTVWDQPGGADLAPEAVATP